MGFGNSTRRVGGYSELAMIFNKMGIDTQVLAVAHSEFRELGVERIRAFGKADSVIYDLKYLLPADVADLRL